MVQTFQNGQVNLAGLTVPAVYVDIIPQNGAIAGSPTNIEGLVGVASWGEIGAQIPMSLPADAAVKIGPPIIRPYDMSSYVSAATMVGTEIGFIGVRVSDGTDTAASVSIQSGACTLTGACTGSLGNLITASIQNSPLANSLMVVVNFPGTQPQQFANIPGPTPATNLASFSGQPSANDTLTIAGTAVTFVTATPTGTQVKIGTNLAATLSNLLAMLQASADTGLIKSNYAIAGSTLKMTVNQFVNSGANAGTAGNSITLAKSSTVITIGGATFSGGVGTWQTFWTNMAAAINSGNAYSAPSSYVVATAGTSTLAPILSTPVTLSGGTDGATGVTDATLMGQDVMPRTGMYSLRKTGVDCFTLCDLSTISDYAAIASFALSEQAYAVQATQSGDTIADALQIRINAGIDTPWFKLILGDWPTWYDSYNGVSRLINPAAFAIGRFGNLSPQQSSLNKPLQGISSTQRSAMGQPYSDTELSLINTGGLDVILPASQSPGGDYYSFATGRNASSNLMSAGDEYTRMTNFLAKAAESQAAGSIIGQLQSIQANDQTRQNAKALFDGFSQQLANPATGLGINGQGMIDGWATQCDLNNNPPASQALGYLFLYWQVRYLNVVRYFVVKFQGGGNVTVASSNTSFADATLQLSSAA